jgi:two-component system sensor histidine kinase KdpD
MVFLPLHGAHDGAIGVIGVSPRGRAFDADQRRTLETFATQIAGAMERARMSNEADAARMQAEAERLRSSLLSSVSHDLRTPLAVITGAASTLLVDGAADRAMEQDLLTMIHEESGHLTRLVTNLLDMTRLAAGVTKANKDWQSIEAVVGAAVGRAEERLGGRPLTVSVPADLPLVPFDAVLVEQVFLNLLENAGKYSPPGAPVEVTVHAAPGEVIVEVKDRGPGVPEAERQRIFDKFYRVPGAPASGAGLGLAICRGMVEAHGGQIGVSDREGGGSTFRFTLPIEGTPPPVEEDGGTL